MPDELESPAGPVAPPGPVLAGVSSPEAPAMPPPDPSPVLAKDKEEKCADFGTDKDVVLVSPARTFAFLGFDKEFIPEKTGSQPVTPEEAMRWMYLASNYRFVGIYLQGAPLNQKLERHETDPTFVKRTGRLNTRGWMAAYPMLEQNGWGIAPIYFGVCNKWRVAQPLSEALGRKSAQHAKTLLATLVDNLGLDLAGAVIYVDDEDVGGKQEYDGECQLWPRDLDNYVDYYRGFAEELALGGSADRCYRFGVYAHPATMRLIATGVPELFAWQVSAPTEMPWTELLTDSETDPPLTVDGKKSRSPQLQITDSPPKKIWPVMRQFRIALKIDASVANAPDKEEIDLDSSYVLDPSEPVATPRLAYAPGTTLLLTLRTFLAAYNDGLSQWKQTSQKHVRRGMLSINDAGKTIKRDAAFLDAPVTSPGSELHPDSPVSAARDKQGRLFAAAVCRDRSVVVGEIVSGAHRPMEVVPESAVRRPLMLSIVALDDQALVVYPNRTHQIKIHVKVWPMGTWAKILTPANTLHPLGGLAASGHPDGTQLFVAGIERAGTLYAGFAAFTSGGPLPTALQQIAFPGGAPVLCGTSAVAAVSPTVDDDLAFAIARDGRMVMFFSNRSSGSVNFEPSVRELHVHSHLTAVVESANRVHVAGIDLDGQLRRWPVLRTGKGWALEDSVVDGKGNAAAPNPWTDIALASTASNAGFAAVAGVDETDDDPQSRTHAFRTAFGQWAWDSIANT
ncbi:hypothetical protein ACO0K9_19320 [Undibacterium sp. Ji50W]|uniref:hypothetical protein n=1 Tax=Undibacterium sp. Ji50W TaxID=3413041 RepID=UPI003BF12097